MKKFHFVTALAILATLFGCSKAIDENVVIEEGAKRKCCQIVENSGKIEDT